MSGPLEGVRIVEVAGIGPGPFAGMALSDAGAEIIRIDRASAVRTERPAASPTDLLARGRRSLALDLKNPDAVEVLLRLVERSDALFEGFRPGVAERLGFGPAECLARNRRLVYGRMTGWGQDGPLSSTAGHDIDYIAVAGALAPIGPAGGPPVPPLNLIGDFGGGGMLMAFGLACALFEAQRSGQGQVVDVAMVDGAALLMTMAHAANAAGQWSPGRGNNRLDGSCPFYTVYETSDHRYMAVGALEPQFFAELVAGLGLEGAGLPAQQDRGGWPLLRERFAAAFAAAPQSHWADHFAGRDACVAPILELADAPSHPHNVARGTFVDVDGVPQPGPAPRFSRTPTAVSRPPSWPGQHSDELLVEAGYDPDEVAKLRTSGAVA